MPHTPYFGSIDATPLWLLLVAELTMWTGDLDGFEARRDAVDAALAWVDTYGDLDGDGFVEYERRSRAGLLNQGWRDAGDAVLHADGTPAEGPHRPGRDAGLRVLRQAPPRRHLRRARRRASAPRSSAGRPAPSSAPSTSSSGWRTRASSPWPWTAARSRCSGICSTIGHALWTRIVGDEHVDAVVKRLMAPDMFTGWGVRTFSKDMAGYNPVSFYNGSVWPFDTAVIANGMKKHGYTQESNRLAWGLVEAAGAHEYERLPEMFCGFTRRSINKPVAFPMACSPDASSAGALFLILQSMLGIYAQADENIVYVHDPDLPKWLGEVTLTNLKVGRTQHAPALSPRGQRRPASRCSTSRDRGVSWWWSRDVHHRPHLGPARRLALLRAEHDGPRRGRAQRAPARRGACAPATSPRWGSARTT